VITASFSKALFLSSNNHEELPWMFIGAATFTSLVTLLYVQFMGRWKLGHRFVGLLVLSIVSFALLAILVPLDPKGFSLVAFTWCAGIGQLLIIQAWGYSTTILPIRQARRLFPMLAAAATVGAILGGGVTAGLSALQSKGQLSSLLIAAVLLLMGALAIVITATRRLGEARSKPGRERSAQQSGEGSRNQGTRGRGLALAWANLRKLPLIRDLALMAFFLQIASTIMEFQFSSALMQFDEHHMATILGGYFAVANGLTFWIALAGRKVGRFLGIGLASSSPAFALFIGGTVCTVLGLVGVQTIIWGVLATSFSERVIDFGVGKHAFNAAMTPVDRRAVERAKFLIDGVLLRVATIAVSLTFLLLGTELENYAILSPVVVVTAAVALVLGWRVTPSYMKTLLASLKSNRIEPVDPETVKNWAQREAQAGIISLLESGQIEDIHGGLSVCERLKLPVPDVMLRQVLQHPDDGVVARLLNVTAEVGQQVEAEALVAVLDPARPVAVLRAALRHLPTDHDVLGGHVNQLADHKDPLVACLSLIWLRPIRRQNPSARKKKEMLRWTHVERKIDGSGDVDRSDQGPGDAAERLADYLSELPDQLGGSEHSDRREASAAMAALRIPALVEPLLTLMERPKVTLAASATLARMGADLVLSSVKVRLRAARLIPGKAIRLIRLAEQLEGVTIIAEQLDSVDERVRNAAVDALWRMARDPELAMPSRELLLGQAIADVDLLSRYGQVDRLLSTRTEARMKFLRHEVALRRARGERRVFRLLGLIYGRVMMLRAFTFWRSNFQRTRSNAIELLDTTIQEEGLQALVPYLEGTQTRGDQSLTSDVTLIGTVDGRVLTSNALDTVLPGIDHKLSTLYRWATRAETSSEQYEPMDRVFLLHTIPLFKGSSADQLLAIAEICQQAAFRADETIFEPGDEARFLYLIVNGRVEILREGRQVVVFGERDCFGELAILDDASRSTSARALEDTDCLVISREDFQGLLSISPELATGTISVLTRRLRTALERS
jgi:hypothetical protein